MNDRPTKIEDEKYTNYAIFTSLENFIKLQGERDENINNQLQEIIKAQKYTNGNVMDLLLWKMYVKGQMWVVPIIVAALISGAVGLVFKFFT
jgi:hypothetical protein